MKGLDAFINESELQGQLAGDSVESIVGSLSQYISQVIKQPNNRVVYLQLKDKSKGSTVVKTLSDIYGIKSKVTKYGVGTPAVVFDYDQILESKQVNEGNTTINKKVHRELLDYLEGEEPKQYQYDVKEILKYALIDANFSDIADEVDSVFPGANNSMTQDLSPVYQKKGQEIAKMCKWDAIDILDSISFHIAMSIGKPTADKLNALRDKFFSE